MISPLSNINIVDDFDGLTPMNHDGQSTPRSRQMLQKFMLEQLLRFEWRRREEYGWNGSVVPTSPVLLHDD